MTINLNDTVRFKLTDHGKEIWYHQFDELNELAGKKVIKPSFPREDEDGYTSLQLWCFIHLYGEHIHIGAKNVIEPLELICEDGDSVSCEMGEWEHAPDGTYKARCNQCGFTKIFIEGHDAQYNFCPNCGAKMKKMEVEHDSV